MKKKDSAFAEKLLPVLLSTGMVFGFILLSGQFMEVLRTREQINQIARAYMLEMETSGYLSNSGMNSLKIALEQEGLTDVKLEGTTTLPVGYGERVQLIVEGNMVVDLEVAIPFLYGEEREWAIPISMKLYSTAKH